MHREVEITRWNGSDRAQYGDVVAVEEPLEIRVNGEPWVVTMRTPGHEAELAVGWLISEGVISTFSQLYDITQCADPTLPDVRNIVTVYMDLQGQEGRASHSRQRYATSSCGLCGRAAIESALAAMKPRNSPPTISRALLATLPDRLRAGQHVFDRTGGLHAAGLFAPTGGCLAVHEDIGRHNAVDKVIGAAFLMERWPLHHCALVISGRAGFEIVQKAAAAGIGVVCSVSAPSSLAVDVARAMDMVLAGFVREGSMNIYAGAHHVEN